MSNRNIIGIVFEALGVDKVIASLKNLTANFSKANKDIKDISKNTKTFDDAISKLAQSSAKASISFKTIQKEQDNYNNGIKENIIDVREQKETYNSLKKVLDEQKEAYNNLIRDALNQAEIKISDITEANNS